MKSFAAETNSSSQFSMRLRFNGPVSSIFCLPTRPNLGSSVGSSFSVAHECSTPRGLMLLRKSGKSFSGEVVGHLGLLLRVQVIQVAEELVESMDRRQVLVAIAQVVLAELSGRVALVLQDAGDGHESCPDMPIGAPGKPTLHRPVR